MQLNRGDTVYFARILPSLGIYDVLELCVRTVYEAWFTALDKRDKRAYSFNFTQHEKQFFFDREMALKIVKDAEKYKVSRTFTKDNSEE